MSNFGEPLVGDVSRPFTERSGYFGGMTQQPTNPVKLPFKSEKLIKGLMARCLSCPVDNGCKSATVTHYKTKAGFFISIFYNNDDDDVQHSSTTTDATPSTLLRYCKHLPVSDSLCSTVTHSHRYLVQLQIYLLTLNHISNH